LSSWLRNTSADFLSVLVARKRFAKALSLSDFEARRLVMSLSNGFCLSSTLRTILIRWASGLDFASSRRFSISSSKSGVVFVSRLLICESAIFISIILLAMAGFWASAFLPFDEVADS